MQQSISYRWLLVRHMFKCSTTTTFTTEYRLEFRKWNVVVVVRIRALFIYIQFTTLRAVDVK